MMSQIYITLPHSFPNGFSIHYNTQKQHPLLSNKR